MSPHAKNDNSKKKGENELRGLKKIPKKRVFFVIIVIYYTK